jgi:hypothetical protein
MSNIFAKTARSWRLIKASTAVLNSDGELLALPALSGALTLALGGAMVAIAMLTGTFDAFQRGETGAALDGIYIWLFGFYLVQYFVIVFFNTALVGAALDRLDGGDPTIASALRLALRRIVQIVGYAIVAATVGMVLRVIAERLGVLGRFIGFGADLAWTVTTFLVTPIIAAEGLGPISAVERSAELLGKSWGENLIGNAGISFAFSIAGALVAFFGMGGALMLIQGGHDAIALPLFGGAFFLFGAIVVFASALSAVYAAAVYYYAVVGQPPQGFDRDLIRSAFAGRPIAA